MKYRIPYYYREFSCAGGRCEDTCCGGWRIAIDDETMKRYAGIPGSFGRRLKQGIDISDQSFRLQNRRCTFLNQEGLCDIQEKLGESYLCRDCRNYPRHMEDYGNVRELMLSLSCPEAARVILEDAYQGAVREVYREKAGEKEKGLSMLEEARQTLVCMIKDRGIRWNQRLAMVLAYTHDLQRRLDGRNNADLQCWLDGRRSAVRELTDRYLKKDAAARFAETLRPYQDRGRERMIRMNAWMRQIGELEPVLDHWTAKMDKVCTALYHCLGEDSYLTKEREFDRESAHYEQEWENLALYFLQTYFLGAVYDGDVFSKGRLMVYSCLVIREWCMFCYCKRGRFGKEDLVAAAYRFSREVENSDWNLDMIEDMFRTNHLYGLPSMLTVLCGCEGSD